MVTLAAELNLTETERPAKPAAARPIVFLRDQRVSPRRVTSIMVVCGNCAGDDDLPRKTFMASDGSCDTCGGNSCVLASTFFQAIQRRKER
jgi:hypothetical protein